MQETLQNGLSRTCCVLDPSFTSWLCKWGRSTKLLLLVHLVRKPAVEEWGMFCSSASCRTRPLHRKIASGILGKKSCSCGERGGGLLPLPEDLQDSTYIARSTGALEIGVFCVRTCCRLLMPDAMCCIRTWSVLLRQDVWDKNAWVEGWSRLYFCFAT